MRELRLLDYYERIGWMDTELKHRVLRIATGVTAPDRVGAGDWRGDVDLHERSYVAIQRLRGEPLIASDLEALRFDLRRLFRR